MFERKKSPAQKLALPIVALAMAAGISWFTALPPLHIEAAHADPAVMRTHPFRVGPERHGGIPVEDLRNAERQILSAAVHNERGEPLGFVHDVIVGPGGQPQFVRVAFGGILGVGASIVPLKANTLGYDSTHNIVLTGLDEQDLAQLAQRQELDAN
jgi:hypothetical protein